METVHEGKKPYSCAGCGAEFPSAYRMKQHKQCDLTLITKIEQYLKKHAETQNFLIITNFLPKNQLQCLIKIATHGSYDNEVKSN